MAEKQETLQVQVHREEGMYWAEVPSHPGLFASGGTLDELQEAIVEAWFLYTRDYVESSHIEEVKPARAKKPRKIAPHELVGSVEQLQVRVPA